MKNRFKYFLIVFGGIILVTIFFWFGVERITLYFETHSPFPKNWQEVHLINGDVFYGKVAGLNGEVMKLMNAYELQKFSKAPATGGAKIYDASGSENFNLGAQVPEPQERRILVPKSQTVYLSREAILYWQDVAPADEAARLLK